MIRSAKKWLSLSVLFLLLVGCSLPQVSAEDRLFLDVSANFIGTTTVPAEPFEGDVVGGISAIAYDIPRDRLYALSDDRTRPRFYTFTLSNISSSTPTLTPTTVTLLLDQNSNPYEPGTFDPEGLALTAADSLIISSEGSQNQAIAPTIGEYDLTTGQLQQVLPLPNRYIPQALLPTDAGREDYSNDDADATEDQGVQENLGFESLTVNATSGVGGVYEPYRLFALTEGPLIQDLDFAPEIPYKNRLLHYTRDQYQTTLVSEHLYEMELAPTGAILHGVSELTLLDQGGHFLALERSFGLTGFVIRLYQLASGGATDISAIASLKGDISGITPIQKERVLDFAAADIPLENYEAMTFGPRLPNGHRSLLIMSDNNFRDEQTTRLLIFDWTQR